MHAQFGTRLAVGGHVWSDRLAHLLPGQWHSDGAGALLAAGKMLAAPGLAPQLRCYCSVKAVQKLLLLEVPVNEGNDHYKNLPRNTIQIKIKDKETHHCNECLQDTQFFCPPLTQW